MDSYLAQYQNLLNQIGQSRRMRAQALQQPRIPQSQEMPPWAYQEMLQRLGYPSPADEAAEEKRRWEAQFGQTQQVTAAQLQQLQAALEAEKARTEGIRAEMDLAGRTFEEVTKPESGARVALYGKQGELAGAQTAGVVQKTSQRGQLFPGELKEQGLDLRTKEAGLAPSEFNAAKYAPRKMVRLTSGAVRYMKPDGSLSVYPTQIEEEADQAKVWGGAGVTGEGKPVMIPGQATWGMSMEDMDEKKRNRDLRAQALEGVRRQPMTPLERLELEYSVEGKSPKFTEQPRTSPLLGQTAPGQRVLHGSYDIGVEKGNLEGARIPTAEENFAASDPKGYAKANADAADKKKKRELAQAKFDETKRMNNARIDAMAKRLGLSRERLDHAKDVAAASLSIQHDRVKLQERAQEVGMTETQYRSQLTFLQNLLRGGKSLAQVQQGFELAKTLGIEMEKPPMPEKPAAPAPTTSETPATDAAIGGAAMGATPAAEAAPTVDAAGFKSDQDKLDTMPKNAALKLVRERKDGFIRAYGKQKYDELVKRYSPGETMIQKSAKTVQKYGTATDPYPSLP